MLLSSNSKSAFPYPSTTNRPMKYAFLFNAGLFTNIRNRLGSPSRPILACFRLSVSGGDRRVGDERDQDTEEKWRGGDLSFFSTRPHALVTRYFDRPH